MFKYLTFLSKSSASLRGAGIKAGAETGAGIKAGAGTGAGIKAGAFEGFELEILNTLSFSQIFSTLLFNMFPSYISFP